MMDQQMNIHRSLTQSCVIGKDSRKLGLGIERTLSLKNNSKAYFLGKRFQRAPSQQIARQMQGWMGEHFPQTPGSCLCLLPSIRINCRTQGYAISASRDHSYSVAKIRCCIIIQSQDFVLPNVNVTCTIYRPELQRHLFI